jgi:CDP-diacylglycerol--serine O-phosphatidyltransferase
LLVVLGGCADALDGRVARATGSGSRFGSELDSLVDIISFGLAPAMIMYFAVMNQEGWDWLVVFFYVACAAIRLARFNVEQAGRAKRYFHGSAEPRRGIDARDVLLVQPDALYNETMLGDLPWHFCSGS